MPKKTTSTKPKAKRPTKKPATPKKLPRPPVPGLLPVPPEVQAHLERELKDHPVTDKERQRLTNVWTLQYYYGNEEVVYRETPQGVEVLAVGLKAMGEFVRSQRPSQNPDYHIDHPDPWYWEST